MSEHLNATLALAKQTHDQLTQLVSLESLEKGEFGSGPKRERILELLKKLNASINTIQRLLSEHVTESSEAPVLSIPTAHRKFYNDILLPQERILQRAYFEIDGLSDLIDLLEDPSVSAQRSHLVDVHPGLQHSVHNK